MRYFLILTTLFLVACGTGKENVNIEICVDTTIEDVPTMVSFDEVYSTEKFDGKLISIDGLFSFGFEDIAIYPEIGDHSKKGIWLEFNKEILDSVALLRKLSGKKANIIGRFDKSKKGHMNYYYGTISNITCIRQLK